MQIFFKNYAKSLQKNNGIKLQIVMKLSYYYAYHSKINDFYIENQ